MLPLRDKVVVIMGGTNGLGLSAAGACQRAGARVVVVGRSDDSVATALKQLNNDEARGLAADATDPRTASQAIELARQHFGRFDALYHVAGGSGRKQGDGPLDQITEEGIEYTLRLNLASVMLSNRAAVKAMLDTGTRGSILNMGSVLGLSPSPRFFATHIYAAAKAGIVGLTRSAAAYYAAQGIRFNVIAPALVETPMARRAAEDQTIRQFIRTKQPLDGGRIGKPEDLDDAVVYLLSDAAHFVTGQVLCVDGGWCVSEGQIPTEQHP